MGRKRVYSMTLMLMVVCSIASGLSFGHTAKGTMATLRFFRFWIGFGIDDDYPLSITIMSEYANKRIHGAVITTVLAMQSFDILADGMVAIFAAFKNKYDVLSYAINPIGSTILKADYVWRIILMFGALPVALTYYWQMKMPETAHYTVLVTKNVNQAAIDTSKVLQMVIQEEPEKFVHRHDLHLLGTTTTRFLLNITFHSHNLFLKDIFSTIEWIPKATTMNAIEEVFRITRAQTLITVCGIVSGYWFTIVLIHHPTIRLLLHDSVHVGSRHPLQGKVRADNVYATDEAEGEGDLI
ncbi:hypothetical protein Taro_021427 [Colocasia esculenta]|uniref:H(+)/Pi cotransporter n=1 Tax=Colocasia esculenta TaxID=4460 RepID=A0A843UZ15_COLES|nr:hypothetical protein [Colocasia esculenta]